MSAEANSGDILGRLASCPAFAAPLEGRGEAVLAGVAAPAQPLVTALAIARRLAPGARPWVVCGDARIQEHIASELPAWGIDATELPRLAIASDIDAIQDPEEAARRLAVIRELALPPDGDGPGAVVLAGDALDDDAPAPSSFEEAGTELRPGAELDLAVLAGRLEEAGYERCFQVAERGQFAIRGGILDIFSWQADLPLRAEFFGDEIESLREFDPDAQTSVRALPSAEVLFRTGDRGEFCAVRDYIGPADLVIAVDCPPDVPAAVRISSGDPAGGDGSDAATACHGAPLGTFEAGDFILQAQRREGFLQQLAHWREEGWASYMFFNTEAEIERFSELVAPAGGATALGITELTGSLTRGFTVPAAKLAVLADAEIFGRYQSGRSRHLFAQERRHRSARSRARIAEFNEGDLVVHADYGIGRLIGLQPAEEGAAHGAEEVIAIEYAGEAKLYVPVHQSHLVGRYVGSGSKAPPLSRLGGGRWAKKKADAERSVLDYAARLLSTQAKRETEKGYSHPPDGRWQWEFENSFLYRETPDQLRSIAEVKADMESPRPMDRLLCGDVGFGKTEVALRAAFKAVMGGAQAAILVPTTVLAQQHFQTFRERMSDYPIHIGLLSRFRTPAEQRATVAGIAAGSVDIAIGTHRLISKDIHFKKLGLVIVDEEQRFGVAHKERFKELFSDVDVLSLSATPIPRTLYLSLMGVRDMSTIDTPPPNRYPVQTRILPYDERAIRDALQRELQRGGQVYFLHNRVRTIGKVAKRLAELCPGARIEVGHGQMEEGSLEEIMHRFVAGECDVLVCTTIIESGIDIPNANTIIIDRADRFGLADLYQLRGRVGRAQDRAYALLLLPREAVATGDARKRIGAIRQYSALGSGFQIAMRDLEIRGAGNLLGSKQSGHIAQVGFDLYCQLLRGAVAKLQGKPVPGNVDVGLRLDFVTTSEAEFLAAADPAAALPAFLPASLIDEPRTRILAYRDLAGVGNKKELRALEREWRDRFGKLPPAAENLLACTSVKLAAAAAGIETVEVRAGKVMLTRNGDYLLPGKKFPRLTAKTPEHSLKELLQLIRSA